MSQISTRRVNNAIARACKVNPSLLLYHFRDRGEIFYGVIQELIGSAQTLLDAYNSTSSTPQEALCAVVDGMFDWIALDRERQALLMQFYHQCIFKEPFRKLHHRAVLDSNVRIEKI